MKFANIVPTAFLQAYGTLTDYHLALAHLILDETHSDYKHFMRNRADRGDFVILDNSLIELGYALPVKTLLQAVEACRASEIVLPDAFMRSTETVRLVREAVKELKAHYTPATWNTTVPYRLMAVVQGENMAAWFDCLNEILAVDNCVTTIGIPKNTNMYVEDSGVGRVHLLHKLTEKEYHLKYPWVQWHMLGVWDNPVELQEASRFHWIRGCDTSIAWTCAQMGLMFDGNEGLYIPRPKVKAINFNDTIDRFPMITANNIMTMLRWSKYYE